MTQASQVNDVAREVFSQIRTTIVLNMRFLDMAVFRLKLVPERITLATDGEHLLYNPVWLLKRFRRESNAVVRDYLHVLLHCIFPSSVRQHTCGSGKVESGLRYCCGGIDL